MAYPGGKANVARHLLPIFNHPLFDGCEYGEFFIGMAHTFAGVKNKSLYHANDLSAKLIRLHEAVQQDGVKSLPRISRDEYESLRREDGDDLASAVGAFVYSFLGKEWGGYLNVDKHGRKYAKENLRHLAKLRRCESYQNTVFEACCYTDYSPTNMLIYNDIPYKGTMGYRVNKRHPFDHKAYWEWVRKWSEFNIILTSELKAPPDFKRVNSWRTRGRKEHLFIWEHTPPPMMHLVEVVMSDVRL